MKQILIITSYPPRECGIATFSNDLANAITHKFGTFLTPVICALETETEQHTYPEEVKYKLNTSHATAYPELSTQINHDETIQMVCIQHEFGLFREHPAAFMTFLREIRKPLILVFHTVLANPIQQLRTQVKAVADACQAIIVMTNTSSGILHSQYHIPQNKIRTIPHGTHLVSHKDKRTLKTKYGVSKRKILTTFGLLSPGKSIETTLEALPQIITKHPDVLFLIIGKTHPAQQHEQGENYRNSLRDKIIQLQLTDHVRFINYYLELPILLEYLQLTDIYLFTSADPSQAVSGTFVYALSCGCPIIATPIPHAIELLQDKSGLIFDFKNSSQLADSINRLLTRKTLRSKMRIAGLQKTAATAWENIAISYTQLFAEITQPPEPITYTIPLIRTNHIKRMSQQFAIIQFARGNRPDIASGYTLDDNARALLALTQLYIQTTDRSSLKYIQKYLTFIKYCIQPDGTFLNYVDKNRAFTSQNRETELNDCHGRTIWALGHFILHGEKFPKEWIDEARQLIQLAIPPLYNIHSPRSIAFSLKGLCNYYTKEPTSELYRLISTLASRLTGLYKNTATQEWQWFEPYLTYDNSTLPESLLYAWQTTGQEPLRETARKTFDFLLSKTFRSGQIQVISNRGWLQKDTQTNRYGEQPIDIAGTVIALATFHKEFRNKEYHQKQTEAFTWFLGNNHLRQTLYNPATGGCYDGLEENNINLNQGAESTISYLLARLNLINGY